VENYLPKDYVIASLTTEVQDLILKPPNTDPYTVLKGQLIKPIAASEQRRLQQPFNAEELADLADKVATLTVGATSSPIPELLGEIEKFRTEVSRLPTLSRQSMGVVFHAVGSLAPPLINLPQIHPCAGIMSSIEIQHESASHPAPIRSRPATSGDGCTWPPEFRGVSQATPSQAAPDYYITGTRREGLEQLPSRTCVPFQNLVVTNQNVLR
jgi:hypothetical protein